MGSGGAPFSRDSGKSLHIWAGFAPVVIGATLIDAQRRRKPLRQALQRLAGQGLLNARQNARQNARHRVGHIARQNGLKNEPIWCISLRYRPHLLLFRPAWPPPIADS